MFQFGLLTAILDGFTYEEAVDIAAEMGFECLEVACWPAGKATRRYSGVSHIDAARVLKDDAYAAHVTDYIRKKGMKISSLGYYPNPMDPDKTKRNAAIRHIKTLIQAAAKLKVPMVTTFIGNDQNLTVEENIKLFQKIWPPIIRFAEEHRIKIAIENCPMLFTGSEWPGGQNLMHSPVIFRELFKRIPSKYFGLNFDPSHYVWQQMDYIRTVYEFKDRLFHVHFKDIRMFPERLAECGVMAYPLQYMAPVIPGHGDVDWGAFVAALNDIRYNGCAVIEIEDKAYESSKKDVLKSISLSKRYLDQLI